MHKNRIPRENGAKAGLAGYLFSASCVDPAL
jgi:hypothetical protein